MTCAVYCFRLINILLFVYTLDKLQSCRGDESDEDDDDEVSGGHDKDDLRDGNEEPPKWIGNTFPIRYTDTGYQADLFCDRIFGIIIPAIDNSTEYPYNIVSLGVLIDNQRILTSHSPYRYLIKKRPNILNELRVAILINRSITSLDTVIIDGVFPKTICRRPVIPMHDMNISRKEWHGVEMDNRPLHDLLVLKLEKPLTLWDPPEYEMYYDRFIRPSGNVILKLQSGPTKVEVATIADEIFLNMIQVIGLGLGLFPASENQLQFELCEEMDEVLVDCKDWLPNNHERFICFRERRRFNDFLSSTMLFSEQKLFGVGSFIVWKDNQRILVFTDVRQYVDLIYKTCDHIA